MSESANLISFDAHYSVPPVEAIGDSPAEILAKQQRIARLKEERNAVILAHNYQRDEVQEIADYVGDSLGLSQQAAATPAEVIVFCGVHFMAETAAILCPEKTVLLPDLRAGCSLAATISADELRAWKARYPDAVVVAYINTTAEVKAESDYCCTSANAAKVVRAIPSDRPILFIPDKFLATVVARETGRANIIAYPGYCHVHRTIRPAQVLAMMDENPDIELLIHPECGCVSSCMARVADGTLPRERTFFLSTEGMMRHISESDADEFAIGTEVGMLHRLRKAAPDKLFRPVNPEAVCEFMKTITLDRILRSLEILEPQICVPQEIARRARRAIDRMLEIA
ncbi:MAG: quinolinate synthase NadA [Candidatus Acidiferrales bacterium]